MKYKDRDELVAGLRQLADFIEAKGVELPISYYPSVKLMDFVYDSRTRGTAVQQMGRAAKTMAPCEKTWEPDYLNLKRKFGRLVELELSTNRRNVCERRVVGVEEVPERVIPASTREIVEWDCAPALLAVLDEQSA